uniref:UDP-arabinopyranose mutase 1 n=1 Tax=Rhizophora mucronata TaxID=61149 RepID=A0A2P2Q6S8_RHIMU
MVRLKEWPPHLQEIQIPYCGYHYVKLIFQQRGWVLGHQMCISCRLDHCHNPKRPLFFRIKSKDVIFLQRN